MAEIVALPEPMDESGFKSRLMDAARFACADDRPVIGYALVALHADGGRTIAGSIDVNAPIINDPLFVSMVCEDVRSHFMTGSAIKSHLDVDEEC